MRQFVGQRSLQNGAANQWRWRRTGGNSLEAVMNATDLPMDAEPVVKDWLMKRNCSVSPRQFVCFYVSLALFSLIIALMLVVCGAWLVLPFTSIELLVVGAAFVVHARHAVDYERIRLFPNRLVIEQMSAEQLTQFEFNPRWVRVEPGATPRDPIKLVSRGQTVTIGQHLAQYRRKQFANELRVSLMRCG
jgi:uncharacterized membrane protein